MAAGTPECAGSLLGSLTVTSTWADGQGWSSPQTPGLWQIPEGFIPAGVCEWQEVRGGDRQTSPGIKSVMTAGLCPARWSVLPGANNAATGCRGPLDPPSLRPLAVAP